MLYYNGRQRIVDANGDAVSDAKVNFYLTGTLTPADVYTDVGLQIKHVQPVRSTASGFLPPIYLDPSITYKSITTDASDVAVPDGTIDPVTSQASIGFGRTDPEASASVTPVNYQIQPYDVVRQGAKGDGSTSDMTAFTQSISAASGREVRARSLNGTYRFPAALATSGNVTVRGEGTSGGRVKARMEFAATPGAAVAQWDFTAATSYVNFRDLQVGHISEPGALNHGIGLSFANAPFGRWDNLWISSFNVGINVTGQFFYSGLRDVVSDKNYTANLQVSGQLWNGAYILGGQFSHCVNGYGIDFQATGSHATLYSVYREGNNTTGIHNGGAHVINDIGGYFEENAQSAGAASSDIFNDITFPHWTAKYTLIGAYFNGSHTSGKALCRSTLTGWFAVNNKFVSEAGTPAFLVGDSGGADRGINGSVFIGNEYSSEYATEFGINEDARMNFFDSKHPQTRWSNGVPASVNMHVGMYFFNKNTALPYIRGWRCIVPGRVSSIPTITTKATTVNGSKIITIDVSNNTELVTGEYIQVAGEAFGSAGFAKILACNSNGTITVDTNASTGVSAAAITYKTASVVTDAHEQISSDQGDANRAYTIGVDPPTYLYATALTGNRTLTLNATNAYNGARFRAARTGLGAFTLDVGGLKTLPAGTAAYAECQHDGTNWKLIAYGTL